MRPNANLELGIKFQSAAKNEKTAKGHKCKPIGLTVIEKINKPAKKMRKTKYKDDQGNLAVDKEGNALL